MANDMILNTGTILVRGLNEGAVKRVLDIVQGLNPRHALLRYKNVGALGRFDAKAEAQNLTRPELEDLATCAIGAPSGALGPYNTINGSVEPNTRLFPVDLNSRSGCSVWVKLTNWQANGAGMTDPNSNRRGRVTSDFWIAPFFEHLKENESGVAAFEHK